MIYVIPSRDKDHPNYDEKLKDLPDDQFQILVKWRTVANNIQYAKEAFRQFYEKFDGESLEGNKKKKIPPRHDLLFMRDAMRKEITTLHYQAIAVIQSGYRKVDGKTVFMQELFVE